MGGATPRAPGCSWHAASPAALSRQARALLSAAPRAGSAAHAAAQLAPLRAAPPSVQCEICCALLAGSGQQARRAQACLKQNYSICAKMCRGLIGIF